MHFSKIELRREADVVTRSARAMMLDGYRLHQAFWRLFKGDEQTQRDFLYRRLETARWPCFYVVSTRRPDDEQGVWSIQMKDYNPQLIAGQRLAFSLCANPVVTKPGANGKPVRHDVMMNAKQELRNQGTKPVNQNALIQQTGHAWLDTRADKYGFRLEQVRVDGYRQHQFWKARGKHRIRLSTVEFNGVLTVTEPQRFRQTLFDGIGPAKGFGCGLLLVKHAQDSCATSAR